MFNYKRLSFVLSILLAYFILTDTILERQIKNSAWSLIGVATDEGQQVASDAPTSFIDTMESGRTGFAKFLNGSHDKVSLFQEKAKEKNNSPLYYFYSFCILILGILYYLSSYIITFYPILILILYYILTSRLFKKDDYYGDFGAN